MPKVPLDLNIKSVVFPVICSRSINLIREIYFVSGIIDSNLFLNNGFEHSIDDSRYASGWSCQGDSDDYQPMYLTNYKSFNGTFSGMCTQRSKRSDGPGQNIGKDILFYDSP